MCSLPPWKPPLVKSLSHSLQFHGLSSGFMQLATINSTTGLPNCRTVVFRGFLSDKPGLDYATSTPEGSAALLENPCGIIRCTSDIRSEKLRTLLHGRAIGELCWYHASTCEQYRLSVCLYPILAPNHPQQPDINGLTGLLPAWTNVLLSSSDKHALLAYLHEERANLWNTMNDDIKASMAWPSPGEPLDASNTDRPISLSSDDDEAKALEHFVMILAVPWRVDCVELNMTPFRRTLWQIDTRDQRQPELDIHMTGQANAWRTIPLNP